MGDSSGGRVEAKIYWLAILCGLVSGAAFIVPRLVPNSEGGLAAAATGILTFLLMLGLALLFALYLLTFTLRHYATLPTSARVAGVGPAVLLAVALLGLIGFLSY